jgi:hypothetical protein
LVRYRERLNKEFGGIRQVLVFLTPEGWTPEDEGGSEFISCSYESLLTVLERIIAQRKAQLTAPVAIFIEHYLETLRRLTMQDDELVKLCKAIYGKHREAVDAIVEYGKVSPFQQVVEERLARDGEFEVLAPSWFIPMSWTSLIPENGKTWSHLRRPVSVCCWLFHHRAAGKVGLIFEMSRMHDPSLRLKCAKALKDAGFRMRKDALREEAVFSRFFTEYRKVDEEDEDGIRNVVDTLLDNARPHFEEARAVFERVFREASR